MGEVDEPDVVAWDNGPMRLILVRHGQTHSNVKNALDSDVPGADLTDLGRKQAEALVDELSDEPIDAIWVSTLVRTQQTAAPLAASRGLTPVVRDGLREVRSGDYEMRSDDEAIHGFIQTIVGWQEDPEIRMPGAETGTETLARFNAVVDEIDAGGDETVMLVAHGAIIVLWAAATVEVPPQFLGHSISNTGVVIVEGSQAEGWRLERWESHALGGSSVSDIEGDGPVGYPDEAHPHGLAVAGGEADLESYA